MSDEFYTRAELLAFGFSEIGEKVFASRKASFYAISGTLGNNIRIDDFCVLKGNIQIRSFVHVGSHCSLSGVRGQILIAECVSLSTRVSIFTGSDSYSEDCLNGPMVPSEFVKTTVGDVLIGQGAVIGAHSVILPGVSIGDGASIGAMCVINVNCEHGAVLVAGGGRPRKVRVRDVASIRAQVRQVLYGDQSSV